jgi:single-stranded-DNA-specific exonuclease
MPDAAIAWQVQSIPDLPAWFLAAVAELAPTAATQPAAQLLWQRGIRDRDQLVQFLDPNQYVPTSPFAFENEMRWAVDRLRQARDQQEIIAIWGDFDADGVTATAVLWDGLGQFFSQEKTLFFYIPNRFTESHGLSRSGIDQLQAQGCRLIVTCDTGSTNLAEMLYAQSLGIDVIVTDHHTLPASRPPVTAIVNPRSLPDDHPLSRLSGVAVAYKLVEALYETCPEVPSAPLSRLLDLVAIGLIADLVELQGDARFLAQRGIEQLQLQTQPATMTRPGIARLLELCKRTGDRPTDISFGLAPRINAVSRIQGDARFCLELLTSQDRDRCNQLAQETELANARRKALQKDLLQQVTDRLQQLDLSTTGVIVLAEEQWPLGVLGLVAGQVAQTYGRPTILLSIEGQTARGSARSVQQIDLYELVQAQAHLLERFGGHPFAAGLSLAVENLALFTTALNQQIRQLNLAAPKLTVDLIVTAAELGRELFQALKLLEPCGMGNPVPKLLIHNCWFERVWNKKIQDLSGRSLQYIKTEFELWDDSTNAGFAGVWWGHYRDEVPIGRCDAVVELDFNAHKKRYEVRLLAVRSRQVPVPTAATEPAQLLDWRGKTLLPASPGCLVLERCPTTWTELQAWLRRAQQLQQPIALAYPAPDLPAPSVVWQQLVGVAKYLSRTGQTASRSQLLEKLAISDRTLELGMQALTCLGFSVNSAGYQLQVQHQPLVIPGIELAQAIGPFLDAVRADQFQRRYFYQVPLSTLAAAFQLNNAVSENE